MTANKYRGEVSAEEFGKGARLLFSWTALAELEEKFGEDYWSVIVPKLEMASATATMALCHIALQNHKGERLMITDADFPEAVPVATVARKLLDALCLGTRGMDYDAVVAEVHETIRKSNEGNLLAGLKASPSE